MRCHWYRSCTISYITCKTFPRVFKAVLLFMLPGTNWFGQILSDLLATAAKNPIKIKQITRKMCQKNFPTLKWDILRNIRWALKLICHFSTEYVTYEIHPYTVSTTDNCSDPLTIINPYSPVRRKRFRKTV